MLAPASQIFSFTFCTWRWNPCLEKEPFCIQPRCIWDLNAFAFSSVFIFCFVFLLCLINTFPSKEAKHSLCSVPLAADSLTQGDGDEHGEKRDSLYLTTKIILSPWHVQQPQRESDIWGDWVARVILIYLAIGTEGFGSSKWAVGVRMSQGFGGGNTEQVKK